MTKVVSELTWEPTWHVSLAESYIGPQFDHLGYTAPVYTDLNEFSCAFYRPFVQHEKKYPDYAEGEKAASASSSQTVLRGDPDIIQLKVGDKLIMQLGYEKMYEQEGLPNPE